MKDQRILFLLLFGFSMTAHAINFSRVNVAWQYDRNAPLRLAHRVTSDETSIHVFLRLRTDSLEKWNIEFLVQDGYESEVHEQITPLAMDTLLQQGSQLLLRMDFKKELPELLVIKFFNFEQYLYYDVGLKNGYLFYPDILPLDKNGLPILETYISRSGHQWTNQDSLFVMKYPAMPGPADPPMADMKPLAPSIPMDTAFSFIDSLQLEENYFYTFMENEMASIGVTFLRMPPYFPQYRQLTELVEAMLYLTSETERGAILKSKDLKKSFDSFWINNFSTKPRARNAIRKYYKKVEEANKLFTDFNAGWKTDRGMIFIVFGVPDEVYRTNGIEEWYYDSGATFEFNVISSFFTSRTYTLRRKKGYEESWYEQIASIRSGIN